MSAGAGFVGAAVAGLLALSLAWKWQLGMRRSTGALAAIAIVAGVAVLGAGAALGMSALVRALTGACLTLAVAFAILAYRFYRDPERTPPVEDSKPPLRTG